MAIAQTAKVAEACSAAKRASLELASLSTETKNAALEAIAAAVEERQEEILAANAADVEAGTADGLDEALIDRLTLTPQRVAEMAAGVRKIHALPDPVGELIEEWTVPSGLRIRKVRVPIGVVAIVYEARPNVTVDSAALCLKSGNAIVLRGSSTAARSNQVLAEIVAGAAEGAGAPVGAVSPIAGGGREDLAELATQDELVDLIVPRGGESLKQALKAVATVPVIYAAAGNCHVYIDGSADVDMAVRIAVNAKMDRPGTCNAAESLLVHAEAAPAFLPIALRELEDAGVEIRADGRTRALAGAAGDRYAEATEEDWATEFLSPILPIKIVDDLDEAIDHINRYHSGHSESIVTQSDEAAEEFTRRIDSACVYVNASTRFTDGGEFGMGAELGNSTQKLHARGPIAMRELTTYKYIIHGTGQTR